jgi:guanyl-specific ribonuclease Sa
LVLLIACASPARAEEPSITLGALRVEAGKADGEEGVRVAVPVSSTYLVGRLVTSRFILTQGNKRWQETRTQLIDLPQWEEHSFYKRSFLDKTFDSQRPIVVTFEIADSVRGKVLARATGSVPPRLPPKLVLDYVTVENAGTVVYRGPMDLRLTLARIQRGKRLLLREDGAVWIDRAHRLPEAPRGYWREYVHPTDGVRGPGPQRLLRGKRGELYYTPDHYRTLIPLN